MCIDQFVHRVHTAATCPTTKIIATATTGTYAQHAHAQESAPPLIPPTNPHDILIP